MTYAYIVDALRTPRGRGNDKGSLKALPPTELLAQTFRALSARQPVNTSEVSDAIIGCVTQTAEQGSNIGRLALLAAGWSDRANTLTINRYCASGLSAVNFAALQALHNDGIAVGGGVEMMSRVPMASDHGPLTHDLAIQQKSGVIPIGIAADAVASLNGHTRAQCDTYALRSQQRAAQARAEGRFRSVFAVRDEQGQTLLDSDETIRVDTTLAGLAAMTPAFAAWGAKDGAFGLDALVRQRTGLPAVEHVHHAGNAPAMADGASLVMVASESALTRHGLVPRARIVAMADAGSDRLLAMTGAVDASRKALARAGLDASQIDVFEVNEAFAAVILDYQRELGVPDARLNINGGAIALGHAMGSTGGTLVGMALDELERCNGRYALIAICGAAGVATATIIERV